uniref:Uncharacterized protein n=1 Tax=Tetranychus urticae TaxID=32264 RepID=T1JUG4_TETUR
MSFFPQTGLHTKVHPHNSSSSCCCSFWTKG